MRPRLLLAFAPNLVLALLAFLLPPDGTERGPEVMSVIGNLHILALHIPAAVLLLVPLFEFWERHEDAAGVTVRRLSLISAVGTLAASPQTIAGFLALPKPSSILAREVMLKPPLGFLPSLPWQPMQLASKMGAMSAL